MINHLWGTNMIKNSNLNEVFASAVKMLVNSGSVWNGVQILFSQNIDRETKFDIEFNIKKSCSKNTYIVEFNDIDLVDPANNADPATFTVYTETRLFQLIDMLLEQSLLDGDAKCRIYDSDGDRVCEFYFVWESDI